MKTFAAIPLAASFIGLVSAQEQYSIDPQSVSSSDRSFWCSSQTTTCPLICLQTSTSSTTTTSNTCDSDSLTYSCVCGDGTSPNVTQFTQTLPFFICQAWGNQCVSNCGSDNSCSSDCRQDHPCGAQNPTRQNTSTLTQTRTGSASATGSDSPASASADGSGVYTGFGGSEPTGDAASSAASDSGAGKAVALQVGQTFGLVAVIGCFFGGFALML